MLVEDLAGGAVERLRRAGGGFRSGGVEGGRVEGREDSRVGLRNGGREGGDVGSRATRVVDGGLDEELATVEMLFRETDGDGNVGLRREVEVGESSRGRKGQHSS